MSIRLRLALWYGALTGTVLVITAFLSYAFHSRGHYDDLDRMLETTASHSVEEVMLFGSDPHLTEQMPGLEVALRLYDSQGRLLQGIHELDHSLPIVVPQDVLLHPTGPAFDWIAGLTPPLMSRPYSTGEGAFATITSGDQRWRVYILPVRRGPHLVAYLEASASLRRLDSAMQAFQRLLLGLVTVTVLLGFVVSSATAKGALKPVSRMIRTAEAIAHSRDLSQRIEASRHRDELGHLAKAFNRMLESLDEAHQIEQRFISDASHELRAPLTAIQGNVDILLRHPDMPSAEREMALRETSRETHRLSRLVADMLALARADAGISLPRQRVEVDRLVLEAVKEARHLARGQTIEVDKLEPAILLGDGDRLKQLLLILLDNAVKYTPAGGRVSVELGRQSRIANILVRDTGVGIPDDALPHLFERFYRADPARARDPGGTGLGLSIAQWIVDQHGGRIEVQSCLGVGTTVTVMLPITA